MFTICTTNYALNFCIFSQLILFTTTIFAYGCFNWYNNHNKDFFTSQGPRWMMIHVKYLTIHGYLSTFLFTYLIHFSLSKILKFKLHQALCFISSSSLHTRYEECIEMKFSVSGERMQQLLKWFFCMVCQYRVVKALEHMKPLEKPPHITHHSRFVEKILVLLSSGCETTLLKPFLKCEIFSLEIKVWPTRNRRCICKVEVCIDETWSEFFSRTTFSCFNTMVAQKMKEERK